LISLAPLSQPEGYRAKTYKSFDSSVVS
jgi:hypothetical protein